MYKGILTLFLLCSLILFLYYPVKDFEALQNTETDTTPLSFQICGLVILQFVLLCIIWVIPDSIQKEERKPKRGRLVRDSPSVRLTKEESEDALKDGTYVKIEDEEQEEYAERS